MLSVQITHLDFTNDTVVYYISYYLYNTVIVIIIIIIIILCTFYWSTDKCDILLQSVIIDFINLFTSIRHLYWTLPYSTAIN